MLPTPPLREVPPTTAAAMAFSSNPTPCVAKKEPNLTVCSVPTTAHKTPIII